MKCPDCKATLKKHRTYRLRGDKEEAIGHHYYCPSMGCNYERDE